ncbi:MAG: class II aldolase/adducin family protein [Clostridiales bacterium]|jgi:L-ribulose-5-phosphate 4-epimerase|nr:class II aldolase/adducin family protein [Clostridiales bacterium]
MKSKDEHRVREALVEYGIRLVKEDLVQGTWGNISARLDNDYMICTPSGMDYLTLTTSDMVKVKINTLEYDPSENKPTSEKFLHALIYKNNADAGGIIHTHSTYPCIYAACNKDMIIDDSLVKDKLGSIFPCAEYGRGGTDKLAKNIARAISDNHSKGCFMSHHGMVCYGIDLEDAFNNCNLIDSLARHNIDSFFNKQ